MTGRGVSTRLAALVICLAALAGVAAGAGLHLLGSGGSPQVGQEVSELHGQAVWPAGARPAPNFALRDQDGHRITLASLRGQPALLAFLGPRCGPECMLLAAGLRALPGSTRLTLVVISADRGVGGRRFSPLSRLGLSGKVADWHLVLGTPAQLAPVWHAYGVDAHGGGSQSAPRNAIYVLDARGFERAGFVYPFLPTWVSDDLQALAKEG